MSWIALHALPTLQHTFLLIWPCFLLFIPTHSCYSNHKDCFVIPSKKVSKRYHLRTSILAVLCAQKALPPNKWFSHLLQVFADSEVFPDHHPPTDSIHLFVNTYRCSTIHFPYFVFLQRMQHFITLHTYTHIHMRVCIHTHTHTHSAHAHLYFTFFFLI